MQCMQYGEVVDLNLARDKQTGKPRGFAFLAYEDQRSTNLAVDNLSGAKVAGRIVRVEHVGNYKKQKAEVCGQGVEEREREVIDGGREWGEQRRRRRSSWVSLL
jgi:RNA-binding motif X-linked protein 2